MEYLAIEPLLTPMSAAYSGLVMCIFLYRSVTLLTSAYFSLFSFFVLLSSLSVTGSLRQGAKLSTGNANSVYCGIHSQFCGPHLAVSSAVCTAAAQTQVLPSQQVRLRHKVTMFYLNHNH